MTEKVSTLIIESNLDCEKCYRKIQKLLCKLQEKEKIRTINFDTKKNTVTVSGPFDPVKLSGKLRCKACEAIKGITIVEEKKTDTKKPEEKKPEEKKKPADDCCKCCKKPDEKKPDDCCKCCKKSDEKKPDNCCCKKPEEKKPKVAPAPSTTVNLQFTQICNLCYPWPCSDPSHGGGVHQYPQPKPQPKKPEEKPKVAPAPSTTVNLQFTQICNLCYPWPCSDPSHGGGVHQYPQPKPQPKWPCEPPTMPAIPGHQHYPYTAWPAPTTPKRQQCPPYCGCGSCGGGYNGWPPAMPTPLQMMQPPPMGCGGPSSCRGCKGCRIVQEGRFIYEEYPPTSCTVM